MREVAELVAAEDAPAVDGVGADADKVADFPGNPVVVVGDGVGLRFDVFAVTGAGVVEALVTLSLRGRVREPGFGEGDAFLGALVLETERLEDGDDVGFVGAGEGGGGGVVSY